MKNRLLLCLLVCGLFMYYAIPRLNVHVSGVDGIFSIAWLILAFFVIGGNLTGYLYAKNKVTKRKVQQLRSTKKRRYVTSH